MWELEPRENWKVAAEALPFTYEAWRFVRSGETLGQVGFMRLSLLDIPTVWFSLLRLEKAALREIPRAMDDLQKITRQGILYAEVEAGDMVGTHFALFAGFALVSEMSDRSVYLRRI